MNKVWLIIQREYLSRVKKKSFIVLTLLVPVLFVGMIFLVGYLTMKGGDLADKKKIEVIDESGMFAGKLKSSGAIAYSYSQETYATAKTDYAKNGYNYLLHVPATVSGIELLSDKKPSTTTLDAVEDALTEVARSKRLMDAGIDTAMLARAQQRVSITARQMTDSGEKDAQTYVAYGVGLLSAFLIYMCLFIYGTQVMRGVIEEKVSRIVEVIISSVKPFQLMLGKIIGVGMVGLTQFILWIVIATGLAIGAATVVDKGMSTPKTEQVAAMHDAAQPTSTAVMMQSFQSIPVASTVACFLFYFLFGYMLYSAIFAVVGSAVDNETETQQFMLPITLPLIFTFILSQSFIINNPDSSLAIWLSMIPFTSPIAMMIRIPFGVPVWQIATSMGLLLVGFIIVTWAAGRIYRVGILMYGKKASYKELAKWFTYKD